MQRIALGVLLMVVVSACAADAADDLGDMETTTTTVVASTTTAPATTTTAEPATTRTSFEAPPATPPNPDRGPFVGIWRWANTHTRYIQLFEHGVIATGAIVDDALDFTRFGEWDVRDGVMTIAFLEHGFEGCDDSPGTYAVRISAQNLVMEIVDDPCEGRAVWLIGSDRTTRTWLPDDADAP
jgi:hypothetical protein